MSRFWRTASNSRATGHEADFPAWDVGSTGRAHPFRHAPRCELATQWRTRAPRREVNSR